jgi:hypothetical protein
MELLAYHKYLLQVTNADRASLAARLLVDVVQDQNPMAFELLEMTGDKEYTQQTFFSAADLLIIANNNESTEKPIGDTGEVQEPRNEED